MRFPRQEYWSGLPFPSPTVDSWTTWVWTAWVPLHCKFFSNGKCYSTTQSAVDWIHRCGPHKWRKHVFEGLTCKLSMHISCMWILWSYFSLQKIYFSGKVKVAQLYLTLCDPMDYTVHGIPQVRILEWVLMPSSRGSSQPRDWTQVSCIAGRVFTSWASREAQEY